MVGTFGLRMADGPALALRDVLALVTSLRTLSLANASLSPASDLLVSAVNPSRLEVDEARDDRGRGMGSETDRIVGLSSTSI